MQVTQEVILDLLPLYLAGEASPATRALVEEYLAGDPELARRIRLDAARGFDQVAPLNVPPELELQSLKRTRGLLVLLRWLFALGISATAIAFSAEMSFREGRLREFHFLIQEFPLLFGPILLLGLACWIAYFWLRHRLHTAVR